MLNIYTVMKTYDSILLAKFLLSLAREKYYSLNMTKLQKLMYFGWRVFNPYKSTYDETKQYPAWISLYRRENPAQYKLHSKHHECIHDAITLQKF